MKSVDSLNCILKGIKEIGAPELKSNNTNESEAISYIASLLSITPVQSILLACILESSFTRAGTTVKQICTLLKCSNIEFLKYSNDLDELIKRRMIKQNTTLGAFSESTGYVVSPKVIEAIKK